MSADPSFNAILPSSWSIRSTVDLFPPGGGMPQIVTNPQSGAIYEVVIKSGRIHEVIACPADFDAFNAVKDIPGKMYSRVYNTSFIENYQPGFEITLETVCTERFGTLICKAEHCF